MNLRALESVLILGILVASCGTANSKIPQWSFTPMSSTSLLLPADGLGRVQYLVTNNLRKTLDLVLLPFPEITQLTTGPNECQSPFNLAPGKTCLLTLIIDAKLLPLVGVHDGPTVCAVRSLDSRSADPNVCSRPSAADLLNVQIAIACAGAADPCARSLVARTAIRAAGAARFPPTLVR